MIDCCEPGCTRETLCPVHQALSDLQVKAFAHPNPWWTRDEVLALFDEALR